MNVARILEYLGCGRLRARTMHLILERWREHKQENNIGKPQTFFMCGTSPALGTLGGTLGAPWNTMAQSMDWGPGNPKETQPKGIPGARGPMGCGGGAWEVWVGWGGGAWAIFDITSF